MIGVFIAVCCNQRIKITITLYIYTCMRLGVLKCFFFVRLLKRLLNIGKLVFRDLKYSLNVYSLLYVFLRRLCGARPYRDWFSPFFFCLRKLKETIWKQIVAKVLHKHSRVKFLISFSIKVIKFKETFCCWKYSS